MDQADQGLDLSLPHKAHNYIWTVPKFSFGSCWQAKCSSKLWSAHGLGAVCQFAPRTPPGKCPITGVRALPPTLLQPIPCFAASTRPQAAPIITHSLPASPPTHCPQAPLIAASRPTHCRKPRSLPQAAPLIARKHSHARTSDHTLLQAHPHIWAAAKGCSRGQRGGGRLPEATQHAHQSAQHLCVCVWGGSRTSSVEIENHMPATSCYATSLRAQ